MYALLAAYNVLFFWKKWTRPLTLSTGELLSKHYTHWIHFGRSLRQGYFPYVDRYFVYPACIPFLSMFYPPHIATAWLGSFLSLNNAFKLLVWSELLHYIPCSILAFTMFTQWSEPLVATIGAITLTYMAYGIKLNNPCIVYTLAWIPGMFIQGWVGAFCFGMALLGGYYPILAYITPFAAFLNPMCLFGVFIGMPQLLSMAWYWPKSVRHKTKIPKKFGSVPIGRYLDLILPGCRNQVRGLNFTESQMFLGWIPLLFVPFTTSRAWIPCLLALFMSLGIVRPPFRNASRFIYLFCFFLIWMAINGLKQSGLDSNALIGLLILQCYSLLRNDALCPTHPFTEPPRTPDFWFLRRSRALTDYPYFTGYLTNEEVKPYKGGFSLR